MHSIPNWCDQVAFNTGLKLAKTGALFSDEVTFSCANDFHFRIRGSFFWCFNLLSKRNIGNNLKRNIRSVIPLSCINLSTRYLLFLIL